MSTILRWLLPVCLLLGASRSALAAPERVAVLLLERSVSEGRLRDALRIQLPREVELETAPPAATASAPLTTIGRAAARTVAGRRAPQRKSTCPEGRPWQGK